MEIFEKYKGDYYFKINKNVIKISDLDTFFHVCQLIINEINSFHLDEEDDYFGFSLNIPIECLELKEYHYFAFHTSYYIGDLSRSREIYSKVLIDDRYLNKILYEGNKNDREIHLNDIVLNYEETENKQNDFIALNFILMIYRFFENNEKYKMINVKLKKDYIEEYMMKVFNLEKPSVKEIKNIQIKNTFN